MRFSVPSHDNKGGLDKQSFANPNPETIRCQRVDKCLGCQLGQICPTVPVGNAVADLIPRRSRVLP
jgi:hypothetical protein